MIARYASGSAMIAGLGGVFEAIFALILRLKRIRLGKLAFLACTVVAGLSIATAYASLRGSLHKPSAVPVRWQAGSIRPFDIDLSLPQNLAGYYEGRAPAADAAQRRFTLVLAADGEAVFTTLYIGKNSTTEHGHWKQDRAELVLAFNPFGPNQPPAPITFQYRRHALWPIHWSQSEWGRAGPPVLYRSRPPGSPARPME